MIKINLYDLLILVGRNDQWPMGGCETAVRIEWYKVHGGKKDSNIWKETSQKQKAGLEKEGALKKGSGRAWFCLLYTSPSPRDRVLSRMPSSA